ncbi:hypothetical protein N8728_02030 [Candidatus Pelagibacter sp.]|nr:hypothetical protein [Candidatus Pelagibacter sp.]
MRKPEFKICLKFYKELKYDKFRVRKDVGWTDINNELRYTYCRECEKKVANDKYRSNPIPQLIYNLKKRAELAGVPFELTEKDIKNKINLAGTKYPVLDVEMQISKLGSKNNDLSTSIDRIKPKKAMLKATLLLSA